MSRRHGRSIFHLACKRWFIASPGSTAAEQSGTWPLRRRYPENRTLGFVEMEMKAGGFLDVGCDLKNPNFAAMAEAMGGKGIRVDARRLPGLAPRE